MSNFHDMNNVTKKVLTTNWRNLSGQNNWVGLLSPLDGVLRRYIIHYGEMAQATYDAFDTRYVGGCISAKEEFFNGVGLNYGHPHFYTVTKYIYATSSLAFPTCYTINSSNWMGYIAVSTKTGTETLGRKDIIICLRGTVQAEKWLKDTDCRLVEAPEIFRSCEPKVHSGWHSLYTSANKNSQFGKTSARQQILEEVRYLVDLYKEEVISISICGHSLGAAVATLVATDIVLNGYNIPNYKAHKCCIVTTFLFASPKVGNQGFLDMVSNLRDLHILHVKNYRDVVPLLPPFYYKTVGRELVVDTNASDDVRQTDPLISHSKIKQ